MKIDAAAAVAATGARVIAPDALPVTFDVSTDTRTLAPGDAYLALHGERFDGHDFVTQALERGASLVVVDDAAVVPAGMPALVVAATNAAYLRLGAVARRRSRARVAGITGSTGKTTTKAFLAQILERSAPGRVAATHANENNEIGVAKLLLAIPEDAAYVVAEFGARHPHEIAPLAHAAAPDVAVLTNVGDAHLEIMGNPEVLAQTKWGIFSGGAHAVLSVDDAVSRERSATLQSPIAWFRAIGSQDGHGAEDAAIRMRTGDAYVTLFSGERVRDAHGLEERDPGEHSRWERDRRDVQRGILMVARGREHERYPVKLSVPGDHNLRNVAAAAAAAIALGVPAADVAASLGALELPSGRYERIDLGDIALIYDAYNASMSGTLATLASFASERAERRIAVLASMAELGDDATAMHERVGAAAAVSALAALLVGGEHATDLARGAIAAGFPAGRIVAFAANDDAVAWLRGNAQSGDLVLLKGSRRYKLEEVVAGLRGVPAGG